MPIEEGAPRILVVDDTAVHREIVRQLLEQDGYHVLEAIDGIQGITMAFWEMPDLIISDVMMPDISGYQLCRFLKQERTTLGIPIILMTATELAKQDRFWGLRSGADRYVDKDLVQEQLKQEVASLLSQVAATQASLSLPSLQSRSVSRDKDITRKIAFLLDKLLFQTTIAHEARRFAAYVYDEDECFNELVSFVGDLIDYACLCVHLTGPAGSRIQVAAKGKLSEAQLRFVLATVLDEPVDELVEGEDDRIHPPVAELVDPAKTTPGFGAHCIFGLKIHLKSLGSISAYFDDEAAMSARVTEHLSLLAQELAPTARLLTMYQENQRLAVSDGLTGLYNVRYLHRRLDESYENHRRYGRTFSVVMVDLDHFKQINDNHGHGAGDGVIQQVARLLLEQVRTGDVVARYGGDEFALLLPETAAEGAIVLAERLRQAVRQTRFAEGSTRLRLSSSIGVAEVSERCGDGMAVLAEADAGLYAAKAAGRNAVRTGGPTAEGAS